MNVIKFPQKTTKAAAPTRDEYVCTQCFHDRFTLEPSGNIHCGKCGALMNNLLVVPAALLRR